MAFGIGTRPTRAINFVRGFAVGVFTSSTTRACAAAGETVKTTSGSASFTSTYAPVWIWRSCDRILTRGSRFTKAAYPGHNTTLISVCPFGATNLTGTVALKKELTTTSRRASVCISTLVTILDCDFVACNWCIHSTIRITPHIFRTSCIHTL